MPRKPCGCAGTTCSCVIVSRDGSIIISGAGTPDDPLDLSAGNISLGGRFQVQDTATVQLSMPGEGTTAEPYVLSATATLNLGDLLNVDTSNTTVGYVPARQPDGTFAMVPPSTAPVGAISTDASIDGDGSSGNPLAVHDYANIAWLEGAEAQPNLQWLNVGALDNSDVFGFRAQRLYDEAPDPLTAGYAEFRLYDYGAGLGASLALIWDSAEQARMTLRGDGSVTMSRGPTVGGDTWVAFPFKQLSGAAQVAYSGSSGEVNVSFPANYFTLPPRIWLQINEETATTLTEEQQILAVGNRSINGFTINARDSQGRTILGANFTVVWLAMQQTAD